MPPGSHISYLSNQEINRSLWDACIEKAANGLIYAKSYYLDAITNSWDAVVLGNYQAVLPLPWKRKYFIRYVYPPPFLQQLGLFTDQSLPPAIVSEMLQLAKGKFRFGEYFFNYQNKVQPAISKVNYILDLSKNYNDLVSNYKDDLRKNLKKASKLDLQYSRSMDFIKAIQLYKSIYAKRTPHVKGEDYNRLKKACGILQAKDELVVRECRNKEGELLSVIVCLKDKKRIYLLLSATTKTGRHSEANHFIIDNLIQEFAGQNLLLDFEGSDLPGVAHFYKNFGSINQPYFFYRWNYLPWPVNRLKGKSTY